MRNLILLVLAAFCLPMGVAYSQQTDSVETSAANAKEAKAWAAIDNRDTPQWWKDAKFGIFIHWGPYSVPA